MESAISFFNNLKEIYKVGSIISCEVLAHKPFGVFVTLGHPEVLGLIQIIDFADTEPMAPSEYPPISTTIEAVVIGYLEYPQLQVRLSAKPSVIAESKSG